MAIRSEGEPLHRAILRHIQMGYRVVMEEQPAAYSIRNDLDEVRSMGIEVGRGPESGYFMSWRSERSICHCFKDFLSHFGEGLDVDVIAIAVQDHGVLRRGFQTGSSVLRIWKRCFEKTIDLRPSISPRTRFQPIAFG